MTPSRPAQLILRPTSTEAVALECWEMMRKVKAPWGLGRWVVGAGGAVCAAKTRGFHTQLDEGPETP